MDESQDLSAPQLRFLAALGADRPNGLFFAGDLGQRIFQQAFSWKSLGVDIRGRARTLHINYRTSHQIRTQADLLLPEVSDVDGNTEDQLVCALHGIWRPWSTRRRKWVDWFNHRRLLEPIGNIPPAELEATYHQSSSQQPMAA